MAILGGAKVSDKVNVITNLLTKVNSLIIGGAMAYTFYRAKGIPIGKSLVEEDKVDLAKEILGKAQAAKVKLLLPVDNVIADKFDAAAQTKVVGEKESTTAGWRWISARSPRRSLPPRSRRPRPWSGTARWAVSR